MYARSGIEQAPLQTYVAAVLFAPSRTIVQFSPDGTKLAAASRDGTVMVWDASTRALLHTLEDHSEEVTAVRFSPDSTKLASASDDGNVVLRDLNEISSIETVNVGRYVSALAFSADGFYLKINVGSFKLKSTVGVSCDENAYFPHLQVQEDWILRHEQKAIWLPPELRPHRRAASVHRAFMAFGHLSGTISLWEICA